MRGATDPYTILGLAPTADDVVVHAAWKALLRKYHPDINPGDPSGTRAREINEAFAILGKPDNRAAYDRSRLSRPAATPRPAPMQPTHFQTAVYFRPKPRRRNLAPRFFLATLMAIAAVPLTGIALLAYPDTSAATHDVLVTYSAGVPLARELVDRLNVVMPGLAATSVPAPAVPASTAAIPDFMPDIAVADQGLSRRTRRNRAGYASYTP